MDPSRAALPPRQVGPYQLLQVLGEGTSGTVFLARRPGIERLFALKLLVADLDAEGRERVKREARIASRLDHPGIVRVLEIDMHRERLYLVMDHAPGPTLRERLDKGGPFSPSEAASVVAGLADALHAAHAVGVVHRDVKPDNVILDGRTGRPRIIDFGVASDASARQALTQPGHLLGTPYYMAPEQVRGEPAAPAADIYALGVLLYELLTGARPFEGKTTPEVCRKVLDGEPTPPSKLAPGLDARVEQVVLMAMARDPGDRFTTAAGLAEALRTFVSASGEGSGAGSAPSSEGAPGPSAGPWPALVAGACWTLCVVGLTGWVAIERRDARVTRDAASALAPRMAALGDAVRDAQAELEALRGKATRREDERARLEADLAAATAERAASYDRLLALLRAAAEPRSGPGEALITLARRMAGIPGTERLRAQLLLDAGALQEAAAVCREALARGDRHPELLVSALRAFLSLRLDVEARDVHGQLMRLDPSTPEHAYAVLQGASIPIGERLRALQRAAPLRADAGWLHTLVAQTLAELGLREHDPGRLRDAVAAGEAAVAAAPSSAEAYLARSTALYHSFVVSEDASLAPRIVADLRRSRQIAPMSYHWTWAGKTWVLVDRPLHALAELEVAVRAADIRGEPNERANARAWLGSALLLLGFEERALATWMSGIELAPMAGSTYEFAHVLRKASEDTRRAILDASPPEIRRELQRAITGDRRGR